MGEAIQDVGKNNITTPTVAGSFPILKKKPKREQIRFVFLSSFFFSFSSKRPAPLGIQDVWISRFCSSTFFFLFAFPRSTLSDFPAKKKRNSNKKEKEILFFFYSSFFSFTFDPRKMAQMDVSKLKRDCLFRLLRGKFLTCCFLCVFFFFQLILVLPEMKKRSSM